MYTPFLAIRETQVKTIKIPALGSQQWLSPRKRMISVMALEDVTKSNSYSLLIIVYHYISLWKSVMTPFKRLTVERNHAVISGNTPHHTCRAVFIAAFFIIGKKQNKISINKYMDKKIWSKYTVELYAKLEKKIMIFARKWKQL